MTPIRVPEGSVFVPRRAGVNVALELLDAAEAVGVDRTEVRTVSGGYHVSEAVAEKYRESQPEADETEEVDESEASEPDEPREFPEGDPNGDWTVRQLEAWAGAQDPVVDLGTGDKASKVQAAIDSTKS